MAIADILLFVTMPKNLYYFFSYTDLLGYTVAFTKVLTMYQIYHTWIHPLHHCPLTPPSPIPRMVSTGIIFAFTYTCTPFLLHIHPLPTGTNPPLGSGGRTHSAFLFSDFVEEQREKEKNDIFACLR
jgi:hypothetical protein